MSGRGVTGSRGFTMLETVLATTMAGGVMIFALGMFLMIARTENSLGTRFERQSELAWLHSTARRSVLSLVMAPNSQITQEGERVIPDGATMPPRWRVLLEPDPLAAAYLASMGVQAPAGAAQMQRFEVVLDAPPIPDALLGRGASIGWAGLTGQDPLDFSLADTAGEDTGGVRGVFELRPDGVRERLMQSVGLGRPEWPVPEGSGIAEGWTLWWREYSPAEIAHLTSGGAYLPDDVSSEEGQLRLVRAYPLVRGLQQCRWWVFQAGVESELHQSLAVNQLPAYVELRVQTIGGVFGDWMFEVGWRVGADPSDDEDETDGADGESGSTDDDGAGDGGGGGGGGGGGVLRGRGGFGGLRGGDNATRGRDARTGRPGTLAPPPPPPGGDS